MKSAAVPFALRRVAALATLTALAALPTVSRAQLPPGVTREQMWFAPTAADWQKPVLITFQRTWDDAMALSQQQKRPILVCVNMDGEIASEHYAGVRYRQPDIAKLYEPYVCVIASVYRHNPRDYDEHGHRILCPRFGSVTCGEHIAIEPLLYEKFMDGRRIAPRHIMVELDGSETYDVYYAWDTDSVFKAVGDGIAKRTIQAEPVVRGDKSILDRVASPDVRDRDAVEQAYAQGDDPLKNALLAAAAQQRDNAPVDLLRLPLFGLDVERATRARQLLTQTRQPGAVDLIAEALRVPMAPAERDALVGALKRLGETSPHARTLAVVHEGLAEQSGRVDVKGWTQALAAASSAPPAASDSYAIEAELQQREGQARQTPQDAGQHLAIAEATLTLAVRNETGALQNRRDADRHARLLLEDARQQARTAEQLGLGGVADGAFRSNAVLAAAAFRLGDLDAAYRHAELAARQLPERPDGYAAMAVLQIFAEARQNAIVDAVKQKKEWPPQWLTDVHTAYSVLARHPLGKDFHVADHYDFVKALGGLAAAARILDDGLQRFPVSPLLHARLRARILEEQGEAGLEPAYEKLLAQHPGPDLAWFAGYATMLVAEGQRRKGDAATALQTYDRAIALFTRCAVENPPSRANADHYVAIAQAGRARVLLERNDLDGSTRELLAALATRPEATATMDGLNISAADTARMLRAALTTAQRTELLGTLDRALAELDPELLKLPAYETQGPGQGPAPARRRGGRRGN